MSITGIHTCPACQLPLSFRSASTNMISCPHCAASLEKREDGSLTQKNGFRVVQDTCSPIQIGTRGHWNGRNFEIIGRTRSIFKDGHTNNWTMLFDDGTQQMLVERYGLFAVYERLFPKIEFSFSKAARLDIGSGATEYDTAMYLLERRDQAVAMEIEGETWLFDDNGQYEVLELAAEKGNRLAVMKVQKDKTLCFGVHYHELEIFQFRNCRAAPANTVTRKWSCNQCNHEISLYAWPLSQSCICSNCGGSFVLENGHPRFVRKQKLLSAPAIPLQSTGILRGLEYRAIGFMEKEDGDGYMWREYTLYNRLHGYAFLSEYNGHWMLLREVGDAPVLKRAGISRFSFNSQTYDLFNEYHFSITDGRGEFPGNAFRDLPVCREYIAPPAIWVREKDKTGFYWFHGTHISSKELTAAFDKAILPVPIGVGAVQPIKWAAGMGIMRASMLAVGFALLLIFLLTGIFNRRQVIYENTIALPDTTALPPVITPSFRLDKWRSNLEIAIYAPVENSWFETAVTLTNIDNGKEYNMEQGVELYSGYEGGEKWKEGSGTSEAIIESVPRGTYILQLFPSRDYFGNKVNEFSIKVTYDVPMWRNWLIFLILTLLPMVFAYLYGRYMENLRWQNSPFITQNSNDE